MGTTAIAPCLGRAPAWAIPLGRCKRSLLLLPGSRLCSSARELSEMRWELLHSCYFHSQAVFLLDVAFFFLESPTVGL